MTTTMTVTNQHSSSTSFLVRIPLIPNLKINILESKSLTKQIKSLESKEKKLNKIDNATHQVKDKKKLNIYSIHSLSFVKNSNNNFFNLFFFY
jgi:hypothetical protein